MKLDYGIFVKTTALLLAGVVLVLAAPPTASAGEKEVKNLAAKKAAIIANMHKKASKALVNSAQDKVFAEYFGGDDAAKKAAKPNIDKLALSVQSKFHVEEMCLIDNKGHEIARIVGNAIAPDKDLSTEEASAPFFKPSFAMDPKRVYISPVYISPDTNNWVVAYVTPIMHDGKKQAILHYEHGLKTFQATLNKGVSGTDRFVLAINGDGYIFSDSRKDIATAKNGDKEEPGAYFQNAAEEMKEVLDAIKKSGTGGGTFLVGGAKHIVAFKKAGNWSIAAFEKL